MVQLVMVTVAVVLVFAGTVFVLSELGRRGPIPDRLLGNTQARGIHQGMILYADGNGGYYPGLDAEGQPVALSVEERLKILIDGKYLSPYEVISPADRRRKIWESGPFTSKHYSWAMLQVPEAGGRYQEWRETMNNDAIVLADRNTGTADETRSIHSRRQWTGTVLWQDHYVRFETTHIHDTNYGGIKNVADHIFRAEGDDDAYMIHSGN